MQARLQDRRHERRVDERGLEQRLAQLRAACELRRIAVRQPRGDHARERRAVGVQAARAHQQDLIARAKLLSEDRRRAGRHGAHRRARQLDVALGHQPRQRRRLASPPRAASIRAALAPALEQRLRSLGLAVPVGGARREVRVHHQRQRARTAEVVDDRRDRVVGDVREAVAAVALLHLARDHRLRAEPLEHERKRASLELEHERRLAPRGIQRARPMRREHRRGRQRLGHRQALARVERGVVDARVAIACARAPRAFLRAGLLAVYAGRAVGRALLVHFSRAGAARAPCGT